MREDYSPAEPVNRYGVRRAVLLGTLVLVTVGAIASRSAENAAVVDAPLAPIAAVTAEAAPAAPAPDPWVTVKIGRGEALSTLIEKQGLPKADWLAVSTLGEYGQRLRKLRAGDELRLRAERGHLQELSYTLNETQTLHARRNGERYEAFLQTDELERRPTFARGVVTSSLFNAGVDAGLSTGLVMELADVFGYDIDFALDIRDGDSFTVIYDQVYKDGKKLRDGDILAAEFVNQGQSYRAVRYTDAAGNTDYYSADGRSLKKAFLRVPLDVFRISSGFSLARYHPILHLMRAHKGTDYAAPTGTPVKASGDGRVEFMGKKGGYGNVMILRHGAAYETVYGHLSRFRPGLGAGSRVKQGQVIAYVGMTGLATAPHLHYEFRVNGVQKNPVTVALPRGNPLPAQYLPAFKAATAPLMAQIDTLGRNLRVASNP